MQFRSLSDEHPVRVSAVSELLEQFRVASEVKLVQTREVNAQLLQSSVTNAVHPVSVSVVSDAFDEQLSVAKDASPEQLSDVNAQLSQSNVCRDVHVVSPVMVARAKLK